MKILSSKSLFSPGRMKHIIPTCQLYSFLVILVRHLCIEKDYNNSDIIDHFLFLLPFSMRFFYQFVCCGFRLIIDIEWEHHLTHFFIRQELPKTITADHNETIVWSQGEFEHFWDRTHSNAMCDLIAHRTAHSETRYVLIW